MRILCILLIILSIACKNKKETSKNVSKSMKAEQADSKPMMEDTDQDEKSAVKKIVFPENAIARLQRTPCFGRCPIYTLTVYEDGTVIYYAEKFVEKEGKFQAKVGEEKIRKLIKKAETIGYFEMKAKYDSDGVTDVPSTITTLRRDDELKQIVNRFQGPEPLSEFENYFDDLFLNLEWSTMD